MSASPHLKKWLTFTLKSIIPEILFVPVSQGLPLRVAELLYDCGCAFVVLDVEPNGPDPIIIGIHVRTSFRSLSKSRFLSAPPPPKKYKIIITQISNGFSEPSMFSVESEFLLASSLTVIFPIRTK